MRAEERKQARALRQQGGSLREIVRAVKCSKSSVSRWIRDIQLTPDQVQRLQSNLDRGRAKAANHPNAPKQFWARWRTSFREAATKEIPEDLPLEVLKLVGIALYWAEGSKRGLNNVEFSNSDPAMIQLMMEFFRLVCSVPENKFRAIINIHPHLDAEQAKCFWSAVSQIPKDKFFKTQIAVSRASRQKRDTLPLGTFKITICDTRLQSILMGWIVGMQQCGLKGAVSSVG